MEINEKRQRKVQFSQEEKIKAMEQEKNSK